MLLSDKEAIDTALKAAEEALEKLKPAILHRHELAGVKTKDGEWLYEKVTDTESHLYGLIASLKKAKAERE